MPYRNRWLAAGLLLAAVPITGCAKSGEFNSEPAENEGISKIEHVKGVDRVVLSAQAARRLGIETTRVTRARSGGRLVVPDAAVLYQASGRAFTFTSPAPLTYVQTPITVDHVENGRAILTRGPAPGTKVVTVGSAELLGTAFGVEED